MRLWSAALLVLVAGCKTTDGISRDLGAACQSNADCTDRCLPDPRWPDGFCSLQCRVTDDCPVGSDCAGTSDGDFCLFLCFDDRDCDFLEAPDADTDWKCFTLPRAGGPQQVCLPSLPAVAAPVAG